LNAAPIANDDPWYVTSVDTALTVTTSDTTLLDNDWDPEGDSLTASIVDSPSNGSISGFSGAAGTFTYTPDTSYVGFDSFTYKVNDGTDDSNIVTVSIAVGGNFGSRTSLEERTRDAQLLTGEVQLNQPLTPGLSLIYDSSTLPQPIIVLETFLQNSSDVPDEITAQLTFNSTAGTAYTYDTTGLSAGDALRFALQADATALASGRYDYSIKLTADMSSTLVDHTYSGSQDVVNRGGATHPFGRGWQLAGWDELVIDTGGVRWVQSTGDALWFAEDGSGGYEPAEGDLTFSTLVENVDNTYTLTDKHGIKAHFSSTGVLSSREDRNSNTLTYTYTSGLLTKITDYVSRETTFTYTSGQLTSVTDFAGRSATLTYDGSGRLTSITQPDPDGAGSLAAPETEFTYDATSHQLTKVTNPLDDDTQFQYGAHDRLIKITHPTGSTQQLVALQTIGLPTGSTGNSLTAAGIRGTVTDERSFGSEFQTDRFGNITKWIDQLDHETLSERTADGLLAKLTAADPDGGYGSQSRPVTVFGYDSLGNRTFRREPLGWPATWTYTTFNQVASATDELGNTTSYGYDSSGNLTTATDAASHNTTFVYDSSGRTTSITTPDPDNTGPLSAAVTSLAYDSLGRLVTVTNPDATTQTFAYDTADNQTAATDELGYTMAYVYDALNRLTSITDREAAVTGYVYNAAGLLIQETDALGNATDYEYNKRGWRTKVTHPEPDGTGPQARPESDYAYDATGNLTTIGQYDVFGGAPVTHEYDAAGRRTRTTRDASLVATTFAYDNLNRLSRVTDALFRDTEFEYNFRGQVVKKVLDEVMGAGTPYGATEQFTYNALGQLVESIDPRGYVTSYGYDTRGLLETTHYPDPDGSGSLRRPMTLNVYDDAGRLTGTRDALMHWTNFAYDVRGRVVTKTDPDPDYGGPLAAPVTTNTYDAAGQLTSTTDPLSQTTSFTYDKERRMVSVTSADPDGGGSLTAPVLTTAYNAVGQVTSVTDPLGGVTSREYDGLGRLITTTLPDPDGNGPLAAPVIRREYSGLLVSKIINPLGHETTFQYDSLGRHTGVTDHLGKQTTYLYDDIDRRTRTTLPDPDGTGPLTASVTNVVYNRQDKVYSQTDAQGGVTYFTYDDAGNLLTLKDPVNNTPSFAYDALGRMTMETNQLGDARSYYYDGAGRLGRRVDRNEQVLQFAYDELNRTTSEKWFENGTPVPTITIATTTEGGLTDEIQRVGFSDGWSMLSGGTFTLTFDSQTTSAITWNATAAVVQSALEALSNIDAGDVVVAKTQNGSGTQEWRLTFSGDLAGTNVAQTTVDSTNVSGYGTRTEIEATDTQGGGTAIDEVQTVTLANANDGTFRLAFVGETTAEVADDATAAQVETALEALNAVDNVTVTGSAGGPWTVTFVGTHAGENQPPMNGDAAALASGTEIREITYTYDVASQLTDVSDPDSTYAYTFDNLGRVLTVDNAGTSGVPNVVLTSAYDANSNRTSLSADIASADDFQNSYTYDALNRLTRLDQGATGSASVAEKRVDFAYNAIGQFTSIARFNDLDGGSGDELATATYSYDTLGRLTDLAYKNGGTNLFTPYEWSFDNLSRITQFVSADGTSDYEYDKTSQLTGADHNYQTDEAYTYDANGNRTMSGYTTGDNNQLLNDGTYSYTYDDEGNRLTRTNDTTGEVTEYEWDFRNRLVKVTDKDYMGTTTQEAAYTYDVFNRRIAKAVDTSSPFNLADAAIERYVYDDLNGITSVDGGNVVLDFLDADGSGSSPLTLNSRLLFGNAVDQILAQEDVEENITAADRVLWQLGDHLATVRDLVKNDGTLGEHYEYDSYGQIVSGDTSITRYLYTSREYDPATGLQYNRARWYDAEMGRWISEDPLGFEAGDSNVARYVSNSPVMYFDPNGLQQQKPAVPVTVYIDPKGMPANFDVKLIQAEIAKVLQSNNLPNITLTLTTAPAPAKIGMQYTKGKLLGFGKAKTGFVQTLVFNTTPNPKFMAQNTPGDPKTTINANAVQQMMKPGYTPSIIYANMIIHETLYHAVLGKQDSPLGSPGDFDNTRLTPGYVGISAEYAAKLAAALAP
jgi:RHS repeat-associated protein